MTKESDAIKREQFKNARIKVKTDKRVKQVISRCGLCNNLIYNVSRFSILHGIYLCENEEFTKKAFEQENELAQLGKLRLPLVSKKSPPD
jgi:hypothetical protein